MAREAKIKLEADASGFKSSVTGAANHLKKNSEKIQASWNKVKNRTSSVMRGFRNLALVGGAVVASFTAIIKSSANTGDSFQKMALRTGATTEFLSGMNHVIQLAGGNIGTLETAIRLLSKRMLDVDSGLAEAKRSFERLGISVHDSEGNLRAIEDIFPDVLRAFGELTNETEKVALAQELFGRSGTQLLPLINQGTDAIKDQMKEAKALGLVWSQDATDAAAEFNDMQARLIGGFKGIKDSISQSLFPVFIDWMNDGVESIKEFIKNDLPAFVQRVKESFEAAVPKIEAFAKKMFDIGAFFVKHGDVIGKIFVVATIALVITKLGLLASAIGGLVLSISGLSLTPAGALLTGLGLLAGAFILISNSADSAEASIKSFSSVDFAKPGFVVGTKIPLTFGSVPDRPPTIKELGGFKSQTPKPNLLDLDTVRRAALLKESGKQIRLNIQGMRDLGEANRDALIPLKEGIPAIIQEFEKVNEVAAGLQAGFEDSAQAVGSTFDIMRRSAFNFIGRTQQNFSRFFAGLADGSTKASQVWNQLWADSKATAIQALSDILIDFTTKKLLEVALHGTAEEQKTVLSQKGTLSRIALSSKEIGKSLLSAAASMVGAVAAGFKWLVSTLGPFGLAAGIALGASLVAAFGSFKGKLGFQSGGLIPRFALGGLILAGSVLPPSLVQGTDSLLIRATPGEFVIQEPIVRQFGADNIASFNRTGDLTALIRSAPGRQSGGIVGDSGTSSGPVEVESGGDTFTFNINATDADSFKRALKGNLGREIIKFLVEAKSLRKSNG